LFHWAIIVVFTIKTMARSHRKQSKEPPNKRGEYRTFNEISGAIRRAAIQSIVKKIIEHHDQRGAGNQCAPGFVKGLIDQVTETAPTLVITRDDVNNEVRRQTKARQRKQQQQADVPHTILPLSNHPTLSESASTAESFTATDEPSTILPSVSSDNDSDDNNHIMSVESNSTADEDVDLAPRNKGGRPRGTTNLEMESEKNKMVNAIN
jgi:hypothetical protein